VTRYWEGCTGAGSDHHPNTPMWDKSFEQFINDGMNSLYCYYSIIVWGLQLVYMMYLISSWWFTQVHTLV